MPKKKRHAAKPVSEKQRAADERLCESLRDADLGELDKALERALKPSASSRTTR